MNFTAQMVPLYGFFQWRTPEGINFTSIPPSSFAMAVECRCVCMCEGVCVCVRVCVSLYYMYMYSITYQQWTILVSMWSHPWQQHYLGLSPAWSSRYVPVHTRTLITLVDHFLHFHDPKRWMIGSQKDSLCRGLHICR